MASFYGCSFVYKNLPSELFDVVIMNFDSGQVDSNSIINAEIEYHKKIINLIDEPLVKNKLKEMFIEFVSEDLEFKDEQIRQLEEKLKKLKEK